MVRARCKCSCVCEREKSHNETHYLYITTINFYKLELSKGTALHVWAGLFSSDENPRGREVLILLRVWDAPV